MNLMEEWTFGRLLHYLRSDANKTAEEIVGLFGYTAPSWLYEYENDQGMRPPLERVDRFGQVYAPHPNVYTYLLRASDYPHSSAELQNMRTRLNHLVDDFDDPTYILNYRYELIAWNVPFASRFDGAAEPGQETLPLPSITRAEAAMLRPLSDQAPRNSAGEGSRSAPGQNFLELQIGMPLLLLLFSSESRLRLEMELEEWRKLSHYFLVRFWRTTIPLIQKNWYRKTNGEPEWLQSLLETVGSLPGMFGTDFLRDSFNIRRLAEERASDPSVQLFDEFMHDSVAFWQGGTRFRLQMGELRDGRLMLFRHSAVGRR